jgi:hypothetical protein
MELSDRARTSPGHQEFAVTGARQVRISDFGRFALSTCVAAAMLAAAQAATQRVPDWMKLREGRSAYFGVGFHGPVPACPTFDRYVTWLRSVKARKADPCPSALGGARVTILSWRMYSPGPGLVLPIVHVRLARGDESAWTALVSPVVPPGAVLVTTGGVCAAEAVRLHVKVSSAAAWLDACKAVVLDQSVSSSQNILTVRLLRSGLVVKTVANTAALPNALFPNGLPRYIASDFADAL